MFAFRFRSFAAFSAGRVLPILISAALSVLCSKLRCCVQQVSDSNEFGSPRCSLINDGNEDYRRIVTRRPTTTFVRPYQLSFTLKDHFLLPNRHLAEQKVRYFNERLETNTPFGELVTRTTKLKKITADPVASVRLHVRLHHPNNNTSTKEISFFVSCSSWSERHVDGR